MRLMKYLGLVFGFLWLPFTLQAQTLENSDPYVELQTQGSGGTIRMGETAELAKFRLSNRSEKNIIFHKITFRNYGTANLEESFENLTVQNLNQVISQNSRINQNELTFTFAEVVISRGESLQISIVGRLIYAPSGKTIELGIRRQEDVEASIIGLDYFSLVCRACESIRDKEKTLKAGGIYIRNRSPYASHRYYGSANRKTDSTTQKRATQISTPRYFSSRTSARQSYAPGSKDIQFFNTFLSSKVNIRLEGLFLEIVTASQASDKNADGRANQIEDYSDTFSDFNLYLNAERVGSVDNFTERNGKIGLLFETVFEIPPQSSLLLTGRITAKAVNGDRVRFSLNRRGLIDPRYVFSRENLNSNSINSVATKSVEVTPYEGLKIYR